MLVRIINLNRIFSHAKESLEDSKLVEAAKFLVKTFCSPLALRDLMWKGNLGIFLFPFPLTHESFMSIGKSKPYKERRMHKNKWLDNHHCWSVLEVKNILHFYSNLDQPSYLDGYNNLVNWHRCQFFYHCKKSV